ncbi:MAG: hypothetical protein K5751_07775 [Treponemataceae bacterium]|nr:hypothetical protein [Treponemataceae bacterium]
MFFPRLRKSKKGVCRICGCTANNPCYNPRAGYCWWMNPRETICSHCKVPEIKTDAKTKHCILDAVEWGWRPPVYHDYEGFQQNCLDDIETEKEEEIICPCCGYKPEKTHYQRIIHNGNHKCRKCGCIYEVTEVLLYSTKCISYRTNKEEFDESKAYLNEVKGKLLKDFMEKERGYAEA